MHGRRVFISYSHDSDEHREKVLGLAERLRRDGLDAQLDQYVRGTPEQGWPLWMLDRLDEAEFVLVVCTETYYRRFRGHEVPGRGKGVAWEGALITQEVYNARSRTVKFVPVLLAGGRERFIPEPLRGHTYYELASEKHYQALYSFLLGQAGVEPSPLGEIRPLLRPVAKPLAFEAMHHSSRLAEKAPTRLPVPQRSLERFDPRLPAKLPVAGPGRNPTRSRPRRSLEERPMRILPALLIAALTAAIGFLLLLAPSIGIWLDKDKTCISGDERTENGIVFVRICPGIFTMGSSEKDRQAVAAERPAHKVVMSEFWIGKTEMTNMQYRRFRSDHEGDANLPATGVNWGDAKAACEFFGGHLPTEAQWEYAARSGNQTTWSFGSDEKMLGEYAWYGKDAANAPHAVGTKTASDWGLYDMYGNVVEWVADWYGSYLATTQADPAGPKTGEFRVLRGGAFYYPPNALRSAARDWSPPEYQFKGIGFRCARGPYHQR